MLFLDPERAEEPNTKVKRIEPEPVADKVIKFQTLSLLVWIVMEWMVSNWISHNGIMDDFQTSKAHTQLFGWQ